MYCSNDLHSGYDATKSSETLTIRITHPTVVEGMLTAYTDEDFAGGGTCFSACHRYGSVEVLQAGYSGGFMVDGRQDIVINEKASLYDCNANIVIGLIGGSDGAIETGIAKEIIVDIPEEVGNGNWGLFGV